jgi:predicted RNA binding protein YcfA (HicA-like mRNA interferase family)
MRFMSRRWRSPLGRLRVLSGKEVCAILRRHNFAEVRRRGSHIVMQKKTAGSTVSVPVPDHRELRLGTLQSIIRRSGVPRSEIESG